VLFGSTKSQMIAADRALPGRDATPYPVPAEHAVLHTPLKGPWPDGTQVLHVAMGCFWGAERIFWQTPGVITTAVGYQGGFTPHPTYDETCSGRTGHTEAVLVAYDPAQVTTETLLRAFWEGHDPTQGFRQGNDRGTQYRSALYWTTDAQGAAVEASRAAYQESLRAKGFGDVTTDLRPASVAGEFYYAEDYHQQYLYKVPNGYCGIGGTGVSCPMPATGAAAETSG
jgi:peptide-methionine (S)-S-oxide reductase